MSPGEYGIVACRTQAFEEANFVQRRGTKENHKKSDIDMPEPHREGGRNFSGDDGSRQLSFAETVAKRLLGSGFDKDGHCGRLILVDSPARKRMLRRFSSARVSITESEALFVAAAYRPVDAASLIPAWAGAADPLTESRLRRTLADPSDARRWSIIQGARLMAAVDEASRRTGGTCEWILEGVDWRRIEELLAVPADHEVCGMIAVHGAGAGMPLENPTCWEALPIDHDGFGGGFEQVKRKTGSSANGPL